MWTSIPYMKHLSKMGNENGRGRDCYLTLLCCQQRYEPGSNTVMPASDLQLATLGFIWNYPLFVNQYFIIVTDSYLEHHLENKSENRHSGDVLSMGFKKSSQNIPKTYTQNISKLYLEHPSGEPMGTIHICMFEVFVRR